jgi:hypothetical protein
MLVALTVHKTSTMSVVVLALMETLVTKRSPWLDADVWQGFVRLVKQLSPQSLAVLLKVPDDALVELLCHPDEDMLRREVAHFVAMAQQSGSSVTLSPLVRSALGLPALAAPAPAADVVPPIAAAADVVPPVAAVDGASDALGGTEAVTAAADSSAAAATVTAAAVVGSSGASIADGPAADGVDVGAGGDANDGADDGTGPRRSKRQRTQSKS